PAPPAGRHAGSLPLERGYGRARSAPRSFCHPALASGPMLPDPLPRTLAELFAADPERGARFVIQAGDLRIDYSKQPVDEPLMAALLGAADEAGVLARRDAMFAGERINVTEDRSVLHVALRMPDGTSLAVDGVDVVPGVHAVL